MPVKMKFITRSEAHLEETPPSPRPSSASSNSTSNSGPHRSTSMDSLIPSSYSIEKPVGEESIPTRFNFSKPKVNVNASMQFVKTKPAELYISAKNQIKKAESIKSLRIQQYEEEDYQVTTSVETALPSDDQDWQSHLDKWKSTRRKRNEVILERVIEAKKYEEQDNSRGIRKSKTFNEMRQEKDRRGRRYNLVVHNDDNDLSELGLTPSAKSSIEEHTESDGKEGDNKDAKSDAGFCTGSDTGSDGVFAEDNISDTSSALGDKKETTESLHETSPSLPKSGEVNGICVKVSLLTKPVESSIKTEDCTFDNAVHHYKLFKERSRQKSSTISNIVEGADKDDTATFSSQSKLQEKLGYSSREVAPEEKTVHKKKFKNNRNIDKVDIKKRRSMFELRNCIDEYKTAPLKKPFEMSEDKYFCFEQQVQESRSESIIPKMDINFKEKLAAFNTKNYCDTFSAKVFDRDEEPKTQGFHKKNQPSVHSHSILKQRIASFERDPSDSTKAKAITTECLSNTDAIQSNYIYPSNKIVKKSFSAPFLVVDIENNADAVLPSQSIWRTAETKNRETVFEEVEKNEINRDFEAAPIHSIFSPNQTQNSVDISNDSCEITNISDHIYLEMRGGLPEGMPNPCSMSETGRPLNSTPICSTNEDQKIKYDSLEFNEEYGDDDIDEEILGCGQIKPTNSPSGDSTYICMDRGVVCKNQFEKNLKNTRVNQTYENIKVGMSLNNLTYQHIDDESLLQDHTYQSISDKLGHDNTYQTLDGNVTENDSTYQTLDGNVTEKDRTYQTLDGNVTEKDHTYQNIFQFREEIPPLPPKKLTAKFMQVLDVSWTEDGDRPKLAIPPSMPPPPPPVDDEEGSVIHGGMVTDAETPQSPVMSWDGVGVEHSSYSENVGQMTDSNKLGLIKNRTQFLGVTTPFVAEEVSAKPPPNMKEFIRQELDSERQLILNKKKTQSELDRTSGARLKYTWEDRMKQDSAVEITANDTSNNLEFQYKLAELELEMEEHDREMLQRTNHSEDDSLNQSTNLNCDVIDTELQSVSISQSIQKENNPISPTQSLPIQEFYSAPVYDLKPAPNNEFSSMNKLYQQKTPVFQKIVSNPVLKKNVSSIPQTNVQPPPKPSRSSSEISLIGNRSNKPNIKALSAIPKPKRVENDSWIAKKKSENPNKNYNSHWLIQEAEQRRLDSSLRQNSAPLLPFKPVNLLPAPVHFSTTPPQLSSCQVLGSINPPEVQSQKPSSLYSSDNSNIYANSSNYSNPSSNSSSENINCKMKGVTYNPQKPNPPQKPLPASIISNITQRVSNKSRNNNNDRPVMYNSRIGNHDYMNSESIEAIRNKNEVVSTPLTVNMINARHASTGVRSSPQSAAPVELPTNSSSEDQRLLSVSGKKKCSHCCDELGRGAAMIIESLRLFYHIHCFKCCVCRIQLGNGTAGADVRVRNHKLHCHNCYSNDEGMKFSKV